MLQCHVMDWQALSEVLVCSCRSGHLCMSLVLWVYVFPGPSQNGIKVSVSVCLCSQQKDSVFVFPGRTSWKTSGSNFKRSHLWMCWRLEDNHGQDILATFGNYWHRLVYETARAQTPWLWLCLTVLRSGQLNLLRDIKLQQGQVISCLDASVAQRASEILREHGSLRKAYVKYIEYIKYIEVCKVGGASLNQHGLLRGMYPVWQVLAATCHDHPWSPSIPARLKSATDLLGSLEKC